MKNLKIIILNGILTLICLISANSFACTGFTLKAKDGSVVFGRSLEWGSTAINSKISIIPRGKKFTGTAAQGMSGKKWTVKYGTVGMNMYDQDGAILDGMNEKGLYAGAFFFPHFADYTKFDKAKANKALAPWELLNWILTQCGNVKEAKKAIPNILVFDSKLAGLPIDASLHYILVDASGKSIVIEPIDGKLKIHENSVGVITNSPTYDWHLTNLKNYVNLSPDNITPKKIANYPISQTGQGSGMLGLPGDYTPPHRFVRAFILSNAAIQPEDSAEATLNALRILNTFYISKGYSRAKHNKQAPYDFTQWETITDIANRKIFFRTYNNPTIFRMVDFSKLDFNAKKIKQIQINQKIEFLDVSGKAK
jgi:choloylglycine hydrolase